MTVLYAALYIMASLCFLAYSVGRNHDQINLLGLGVFFWSLVPLIQTIQSL